MSMSEAIMAQVMGDQVGADRAMGNMKRTLLATHEAYRLTYALLQRRLTKEQAIIASCVLEELATVLREMDSSGAKALERDTP